MIIQADYEQLIGEVKERNKFYNAIVDIKEHAISCCQNNKISPESKKQFERITSICDQALENVI